MLGDRRFRIAGLSLVIALLAAAAAPARVAAEGMGDQKFKPGDKAPEMIGKDLAGKEIKLSSFAGKNVVMLNFWGLRCGACLEEMPYLEEIQKKLGPKGLVTLGVDTDGVDAKTVIETLQEVEVAVTYPLITDEDFKITDTYTNFLVPLTIVIDKAGVIQYIHTGFEKGTEKQYEDAAKKALGL